MPPLLRAHWFRIALACLIFVGLGAGGWYAFGRDRSARAGRSNSNSDEAKLALSIVVEVTHPTGGGIPRVVVQPGTVEPFESTDIYAKVSGYLVSQTLERVELENGKPVYKPVLQDGKPIRVDIGAPVKAGDVLARISVPEYEKQVERDTARVRAATAKVAQMEAHKTAAQAEKRAADASIKLAEVTVRSKTAYRQYRESRLKRIKELVAKDALDEQVRDEQEDFYQSAFEAENAALEQINEMKEKAAAAEAKVKRAEADLQAASRSQRG